MGRYRTEYRMVLVVLTVSLVAGVLPAQENPLVGWWKLDEGSGTLTADSSGNGLDGTILDPMWVAPGYDDAGFCLEMDRGNYVDLGNPPALDFDTGNWAVMAWINTTITGTAEAERGTIYAKGGDNGGGHRYTICVAELQSGQVTLTCDDDVTKVQATGTTMVNDGEWHLVVGMRQGTTIRVAIDGKFEGQNTVAATYNLKGTSQRNAYIGVITSQPDGTLFKKYKGLIDDVRVFRRALAAHHLQDLLKGLAIDFNKAGLPSPADGDPAVVMPLLSWTAGEGAMFHNVYFGTSPELTEANLVMPRSLVAMYYHVGGLTPGVTYYWRVDEIEADGVTVHSGSVWSFTAQGLTAYAPTPADGANNAPTAPQLVWLPGQAAVEHHVYFGTDKDAVAQGVAGTDKGKITETTFAPGDLDDAQTYFWRVDEIVAGGEVKAGVVWSFTTILPVEDFESYTDDEGQRIYEAWIDGWTNKTGSTVGYTTAPFAEQKVVHGGQQSMPLDYNNVNAPFYSEAEYDLAPAQDWTVNGVDTLVLHVRGRSTNGAAPLYVILRDANNRTATVSHPDPAVVTVSKWTEWKIPLSDFAGVNAARIKQIVIGIGDKSKSVPGAAGLLFMDDIYVIRNAAAN
jgi:hypothetical protein